MAPDLVRTALLRAAASDGLRRVAHGSTVVRDVVARYVAGDGAADVLAVARTLHGAGLDVSVDRLGEHLDGSAGDVAGARAVRDAYVALLGRFADAGLTQDGRAEVSVKLSALGLGPGGVGADVAVDLAGDVCDAARAAGTTVTVDMEDHSTTDATLQVVSDLRADFPSTGAVLQAYLRRTPGDCADLARPGSRVRLCKGAYDEPRSVAHAPGGGTDLAYVRCLRTLLAGGAYVMVATHDPRLVDVAGALAVRHGRRPGDYEFQMLYGVRPAEQERLAATGERVRVYVPYGPHWYGYFMRRLAEKPANTMLFLRSLLTKG